ncbi:MAG: hypothetical protein GY778_07665 [bacterium]|nr:hypothetical protein [bacterium]
MKKFDRRGALKIAAAGTVLAAAGQAAAAEEEMVDYLFVQNAKSVMLKDGVLTLKGVAADTLYFSDRPERIVGRITTADFVTEWGKGHDSFKEDPPNAVLSIHHDPLPQDLVVVLRDPHREGDDLIYQVEVTDGPAWAQGTAAALFIDVIGRPLTPMSFAGVRRRTRRRTRRRYN